MGVHNTRHTAHSAQHSASPPASPLSQLSSVTVHNACSKISSPTQKSANTLVNQNKQQYKQAGEWYSVRMLSEAFDCDAHPYMHTTDHTMLHTHTLPPNQHDADTLQHAGVIPCTAIAVDLTATTTPRSYSSTALLLLLLKS